MQHNLQIHTLLSIHAYRHRHRGCCHCYRSISTLLHLITSETQRLLQFKPSQEKQELLNFSKGKASISQGSATGQVTIIGRVNFMQKKGNVMWDGNMEWRSKQYKNYSSHLRFFYLVRLMPKSVKRKCPFVAILQGTKTINVRS